MTDLDWSCVGVGEAILDIQARAYVEHGRLYDMASMCAGDACRTVRMLGTAAIFRATCKDKEIRWPKACRLATESPLGFVFICVDEGVAQGFMVLTASNGDAPPVRVRTCLS